VNRGLGKERRTLEKRQDRPWRALRRYAGLSTELVVAVLLGTWLGRMLDQWLGSGPWLLLLGFVFGVAAGFLNIFRLVSSENKERRS